MYVITTEKYFINLDYEMHSLERIDFSVQIALLIPPWIRIVGDFTF